MTVNRVAPYIPNGQATAREPRPAADLPDKLRGSGRLVEDVVARYPRTVLISAMAIGAVLAWWIKRR